MIVIVMACVCGLLCCGRQVRELEDRLRFLEWRRNENESRMRQMMSHIRSQQALDADLSSTARREQAAEKLAWAQAVIHDELEKPLDVNKVRALAVALSHCHTVPTDTLCATIDT